jgi:phenylalanyl-tRNA synthetase beta chain
MTGRRLPAAWDAADSAAFDFYDLKSRLELLLAGLGVASAEFAPVDSIPYLHPGKAASITVEGKAVGTCGELHPLTRERYELNESPVIVAELDLDALRGTQPRYGLLPVAQFPPVLEDIAVVVDESVPAARVDGLIREAGGSSLAHVRLFDLYRGEQIGAGKKSLAYSLTYQAADRTLTDSEAATIRSRIVKRLEKDLNATLRTG